MKHRPDWLGWAVALPYALTICGLLLVALDGNFGCHFFTLQA